MLIKINSFQQLKDLGEIVLASAEGASEKYRIIYADHTTIKIIRRGEFSTLRILPLESIIEGEWFFDPAHGHPDVRHNTDGQLLKQMAASHVKHDK